MGFSAFDMEGTSGSVVELHGRQSQSQCAKRSWKECGLWLCKIPFDVDATTTPMLFAVLHKASGVSPTLAERATS